MKMKYFIVALLKYPNLKKIKEKTSIINIF